MRIAALICILSTTMITGWVQQIDPEVPLPYDKLSFGPVSSSDFVVIGKVAGPPRGITKRLSDKELLELDDIGKAMGGALYTFQVEKVLCAKTDFTPGGRRGSAPFEKFYIFKTRNQPFHLTEFYRENQRYLMFVKKIPENEMLPKIYRLEERNTYYEAFEGRKGLIPLSNDNLPLLNKLKQLCSAVTPSNPREKIRNLNTLTRSSDPELRQSAIEAIEAIRSRTRR